MRDPKVDRFVSEPPKTPFAPCWEYYIAEVMLDIDCDALSTLILEKEKQIIATYPSDSDGYTGLGSNSLTSRFKYFNVLNWDHPEISKVHRGIKKFHAMYYEHVVGNYKPPKLYIRCWANVLRCKQSIKKHVHSIHPHTYIGGHIAIKCDDTSTVYVNPYDHANGLHYSKNVPGKLTLFPNYIPHYTTEHKSEEERITIAFDITPLDKIFTEDIVPLPRL